MFRQLCSGPHFRREWVGRRAGLAGSDNKKNQLVPLGFEPRTVQAVVQSLYPPRYIQWTLKLLLLYFSMRGIFVSCIWIPSLLFLRPPFQTIDKNKTFSMRWPEMLHFFLNFIWKLDELNFFSATKSILVHYEQKDSSCLQPTTRNFPPMKEESSLNNGQGRPRPSQHSDGTQTRWFHSGSQ